MNHFDYHAPKDLHTAFDLVQRYGGDSRYMAGGTDLLIRIKSGRFAPRAVIDIKGIKELSGIICQREGEIEIGALALISDIQSNPIILKHLPALAEAASNIGSIQIRNRASLAGNLCNASPAADTAPALLIYNARVKMTGPQGTRELPLPEFILGPGKTALQLGELVEAICIPIPEDTQSAAFERLTRRKGVDLATINLCCQVFISGMVRIAVGAAGPVPFMVEDRSGTLSSASLSEEEKRQRLKELMLAAAPISDVRASQEYRQAMLVVLAERALIRSISQLNS